MLDQPIPDDLHEALLRDLYAGEHDALALSEAHGVPLLDLVRWFNEHATRIASDTLRMIDDVRSQHVLSRYRPGSISRLINLATDEKSSATPETVRRACKDILQGDLKHLEAHLAAVTPRDEMTADGVVLLKKLRQALYGDEDDLPTPDAPDAEGQ
jgi:hypothetical protein